MKTYILISLVLLSLVGCGDGVTIVRGPQGEPGPAGPTVVVTATPTPDAISEVQALVDEENIYRLGLGQTDLSPGLSCTLYTITGGQYIQNDATHTPTLTGLSQVATFLYSKEFNQANSSVNDGLSVLPPAIRPLYTNLFLLRCQGQMVATESGYFPFELTSDDGSVLYVDGSRVIDNDGTHGAVTKLGMKYLRKGVHTFRLDFAQSGGGSQTLVLNSAGVIMSGSLFYH